MSAPRIAFAVSKWSYRQKPTARDMADMILQPWQGSPDDLLALLRDGYSIGPLFKEKPYNRQTFLSVQVLGIDCDHWRLDAATSHPFVRAYAYALYTTSSHTSENHRFRILFILDEPETVYTVAERMLLYLLSRIPEADQACKNPTRIWHGARNAEVVHIGRLLPRSQILPVLPVATPIHLARPSMKLEKALALLERVPPYSVDYSAWIGLIALFKREFGDAALPHVVRWAQGKTGEVEREWERLRVDHPNPVTLGTLYHLARRGHVPDQRSNRSENAPAPNGGQGLAIHKRPAPGGADQAAPRSGLAGEGKSAHSMARRA